MIGLCDNCALKYADCKGDKGLEKTRCDYYKKPVVMNVKELAERVAELEIELEHSRRIIWQQEAALEAYMDMSNELEKHQWIPVSERLPEDGQPVIITTDDEAFKDHPVGSCIYQNGRFQTNYKYDIKMIAWMPLPTPYKGGDTE